MNRLEDLFFALLRSAIWNTPAKIEHIISDEEWSEIYAISKEQTVSGIMLDAIAMLPNEYKPDTKKRLQWIVLQKIIEEQNKKMNNALTSLDAELKKEHLTIYLLKGQGVAHNYPIPEHRICGDIDIYFAPQDFDKAIEHFTSRGHNIEGNPDEAHYETEYMGFKLEIHKKCATFYTKRLQKRYNEIISSILKTSSAETTIDEIHIAVLPPLANSLQLLSHMLRHIIFSGLGLRQVCDWVLFVYKHQKDIDKELFIKYAKELQLWETYKVVTAIATDYLGLPKEYALCEISKRDKNMAKKAFRIIMTYGNFGQYGEHSITTTRLEYLKAYFWKVKNCIRFHRLSESETWNYPIWQLHSLKDMFKK